MSKRMNSTGKLSTNDPLSALAMAVAGPASRTGLSYFDPAPEEVARLAYSYWQARGCPDGSPEEDWYRAEAELRERTTMGAPAA
ncbi:MAG TPA: DUF2934 domain-containing protein [Bryobacteraceae bacterium]|nr:DUF2934 domain-containing protein [Bryobacteraceae bacterium]